ncbi:hypothetical protein DSO57_1030398 [Entomophthora muscae]|uniref:Uncharacterized protein n=1 Tax=Entomophthora muscae TaxID=34485 RepID=A0ACC2RFP6_9FUNG|nr:hypothetical protein DSO57_1030398 [Entomophthora muscae]
MYVLDPVLKLCVNLNYIRLSEFQDGDNGDILVIFFKKLPHIKYLHLSSRLDSTQILRITSCFDSLRYLVIETKLSNLSFVELIKLPSLARLRTLSLLLFEFNMNFCNLICVAIPDLENLYIHCDFYKSVVCGLTPFLSMHNLSLKINVDDCKRSCFISSQVFPNLEKCCVSDIANLCLVPGDTPFLFPGLRELNISNLSKEFAKLFVIEFTTLSTLSINISGLPFYAAVLLLSNICTIRKLTISGIGNCHPAFRLTTRAYAATHVSLLGITSSNYLACNWISRCFGKLQLLEMDFGSRNDQLFWPGDPALPILSSTVFCIKVLDSPDAFFLRDLCLSAPALKYIYFRHRHFKKVSQQLQAAHTNLECFSRC